MDQTNKEKKEQKENQKKTDEAAKNAQYCTKPFDAESSRIGDDDEPCENSER